MTIDEAIIHCEEKIKELREQPLKEKMNIEDIAVCEECAEEHEQLAEWLKELKAYREQSGDAISRQMVLDILKDKWNMFSDANDAMQESIDTIKSLRPVTPQSKTGLCKDCRWWKDSDGLYRRGGHTESQCPINRREVFEGNGYCYMFEPYRAESEDKE